jgi:putative membrane protein
MMFEPPLHLFWLFWIGVVVLVLVAVVVALLRGTPGPSQQTYPPTPPRETPLDILARRFASGEITAEEYQKGRDLLQGGGKS